MRLFRLTFLTVWISLLVPESLAAGFAFSNYLKDGFTPRAIVADSGGSLYMAGSMVTSPLSQATSAVVAKFDLIRRVSCISLTSMVSPPIQYQELRSMMRAVCMSRDLPTTQTFPRLPESWVQLRAVRIHALLSLV